MPWKVIFIENQKFIAIFGFGLLKINKMFLEKRQNVLPLKSLRKCFS